MASASQGLAKPNPGQAAGGSFSGSGHDGLQAPNDDSVVLLDLPLSSCLMSINERSWSISSITSIQFRNPRLTMSVDDHLPALGSRWRREHPKNLVLEAGDRYATSASKVAHIYHFSGLF
jgi:hypothetical protein